jgi:arsenate reductase
MLVYFLCRENAGRSQMAHAFFERLVPGHEVRSGGSEPAARVHPEVVTVMREMGADIEMRRPAGIDASVLARADLVVSMGCDDPAVCVYPGRPVEDWDIPNPAGKSIEEVRRIRDLIKGKVEALSRRIRGGGVAAKREPAPPKPARQASPPRTRPPGPRW